MQVVFKQHESDHKQQKEAQAEFKMIFESDGEMIFGKAEGKCLKRHWASHPRLMTCWGF